MKLVVFAHTPPPHHGQSYMVQLMLEGFGGDRRKKSSQTNNFGIECYHVNCRVSRNLEDIGDFRPTKFFLLIWYCLQAIWIRFRHGVTNFYYVPAPGKRSALYRDWLVMLLCRPFFKRIIFHWHAAGLAQWLETSAPKRTRSLTFRLMKSADMSIVLSNFNRADAEKLSPKQIRVISNGIADPCPDFAQTILPRRKARRDTSVFKVLYLAHCTREKGLFDTINGVLIANKILAEKSSPMRIELTVAGNFVTAEEKAEFNRLMIDPVAQKSVRYLGFVADEQKNNVLRDADAFCFPTYYQNENQPVNLIEAMAFGLPILTTRWRSIPDLLPPNYPGIVEIRSPEKVAAALLDLMTSDVAESLREIFLKEFTLQHHMQNLANAIHGVEN